MNTDFKAVPPKSEQSAVVPNWLLLCRAVPSMSYVVGQYFALVEVQDARWTRKDKKYTKKSAPPRIGSCCKQSAPSDESAVLVVDRPAL